MREVEWEVIFNNLRYDYDTTLIASNEQDLQHVIELVQTASEKVGLFLNVKKTKVMAIRLSFSTSK